MRKAVKIEARKHVFILKNATKRFGIKKKMIKYNLKKQEKNPQFRSTNLLSPSALN